MSARRVPTISPALLRARDDQTETDVAQSMGTLAVAVQLMDLPLELLVHVGKQMDAQDLAAYSAMSRALRAAFAARRLEDIHIALHLCSTAATIPGSRWARVLKTPGLDINSSDPLFEGAMTALMGACNVGNVRNVRWLRLFGADPALHDSRGWTASQHADYADERRVADAVWCMFALGKSRPKLLFDAMEAAIGCGNSATVLDSDLEELRALLALDGADANAGSEQGMTLLHLACRGSVEQGRHRVARDAEAFVLLLLQKGANNFDIKDQFGDRSVDTATANGLKRCVELLRATGAPEPSEEAVQKGRELSEAILWSYHYLQ